jgi:hypothetical protein
MHHDAPNKKVFLRNCPSTEKIACDMQINQPIANFFKKNFLGHKTDAEQTALKTAMMELKNVLLCVQRNIN